MFRDPFHGDVGAGLGASPLVSSYVASRAYAVHAAAAPRARGGSMRVVSPKFAAHKLGLSEEYVRRMLRSGAFPGSLMGRKWRIVESDIDRWASGEWQRTRAAALLATITVPKSKNEPDFWKTVAVIRTEYGLSVTDLVVVIRKWSGFVFLDRELKKT